MPAHSRVWIYQSDRDITDAEVSEMKQKANMFLLDWTSHGNLMMATFDVLYNRFIVVAADEQAASASGCGIDNSVRFVQQIEKDYRLNLFDRMLVAYRDKTNRIQTVKLHVFEQLMEKKELNGDTIVFNNLISTKGEMQTKWEVPVKMSWHSRMLVL
ncbi:MAG: ABC transporter ATPase [Bacteroidetes bacterium]|nr:ABC transporter ATPase [Bacteroidota bacterium]